MACKYIVGLTPLAEETYLRLSCLADNLISQGDQFNSSVTTFKKLERILEVAIPQDPFRRERALSGPLARIFRVTDDPIRVYYCGTPNNPNVTVFRIADTALKTDNSFLAKWMSGNSEQALLSLMETIKTGKSFLRSQA